MAESTDQKPRTSHERASLMPSAGVSLLDREITTDSI